MEAIGQDLPVFNITMPIVKDHAILNIRGDEHIGHKQCNINDLKNALLAEQAKHRNHMFVINTGDMIENVLKASTGSANELAIPDPNDQITTALNLYEELDKDLYGKKYQRINNMTKSRHTYARRLGVIGNHEYRSRVHSGIWLNKQLYSLKGVIDGGVHSLINLKLVNKKLDMERTYKIYVTHRLSNSNSVSDTTIINNFKEKKSLINADIYISGHYHRDFAFSDVAYDHNGSIKKVLYIINPSPIIGEYAVIGMYNPTINNYFKNVRLPIRKEELIETTV